MGHDFFNFFIIYAIITLLFAIIGNLNFIQYLNEYAGLFKSLLTVVDASLGNF